LACYLFLRYFAEFRSKLDKKGVKRGLKKKGQKMGQKRGQKRVEKVVKNRPKPGSQNRPFSSNPGGMGVVGQIDFFWDF
jgi:hypothetical protein